LRALPLAFFASGAAALLFEVLWFRALGRLLGNTVWTAALVLTAFMLGIALGGALAARWAPRMRRPARAFALAETAIAMSGSVLVWGLPALEAAFGAWLGPLVEYPDAAATLRLLAALAAMLVPTTAMGMTLALGVRVLAPKDTTRETTRALGLLYSANTFGACIAPLLAEYWLIEALGLRGTAFVAAGLNLAAAAVALTVKAVGVTEPPRPGGEPVRLLAAAALAGALALALEVLWFRLLLLYVPGTDVSFAVMLAVMLGGIALGGALAPLLQRAGIAWLAAGSTAAVVLGYLLTGPLHIPGPPQLVPYALALMAPASVCSGALFTLLGAELRRGAQNPQPAIGRLTTANTLGAAAGAACACLLLLPQLGLERSLFLLAAGYLVVALLVRPAWVPMLAAAAALLAFPWGRMEMHLAEVAFPYRLEDRARVVMVTEGPTTTLQVLRRDYYGEPAAWRLLTDSYSMTGIDRWSLRYMRAFAWLPLSLHEAPRRALLISYGAGNTAQALLSDRALEQLTVVDLSPEILAASPLVHPEADPLRDARVRLVREDGRHFLRTRSERFDIITAEPPPLAMAGVVNLYTQEYFEALAARLAPGGLATYWLPVLQIDVPGARAVIAAFCNAFPDCTLWTGSGYEWILMGGRDFGARADAARFSRLWREPAAAPRITADGFERPAQLGAAFLADAEQLRRWYAATAPLTDDHPKRLAAWERAEGRPPPSPQYEKWVEPQGARERFAASGWIAAHWPPALVPEAARYFAAQPVLNGFIASDPRRNLGQVDGLLRTTELRIPVLWLLGTDMVEQAIVERRMARAPGGDYALPLGLRALAERRYDDAARLLAQAQAGPLAAYAACRAQARLCRHEP
jgi:predicted membrane-bound spermidine synthase